MLSWALETQLHAAWAQMLSVIAEIDSRSIAAAKGYGTTVELVRAIARVPRTEARSRIDAAGDVLSSRGLGGAPVGPRLPQTAAAVADHARCRRCRGDPLGTGADAGASRH